MVQKKVSDVLKIITYIDAVEFAPGIEDFAF
jgi:hypothetical protein